MLGLSTATVKSQTSKGLAPLREGPGPTYANGRAHDPR